MTMDAKDRTIIEATQAGLPLVPRPFVVLAQTLELSEDEVIDRLAQLKKKGIIRRVGAAPNHYRLGMTANGMTVWDVDDTIVDHIGEQIGALPFVTHCYRRPRALPEWRFNLFAMVHGQDRDEVMAKRQEIANLLGETCAANDILFSTRILKKTGMRLRRKDA
ncbi:AsnC family transcriptional regulator [Roseibium sediminis]|uniref:siroheme decarboxylase subunit beta n=1 Tax=Roseibium sediminis TaxID=1775174 RepID=UPI00123CDBF4|nr:AsnC family transcriptional regulator [Roseibium sediminis]